MIFSNYGFRLEDVQRALAQGADPNALDERGWSPAMCAAIFEGKVLEELLNAGANPSFFIRHRGATLSPLSLALRNSRMDAIELLVSRGADLSVYHDGDGITGAVFAAAAGRLDLLEQRLAAGDSPLFHPSATSRHTALSAAASRQDPACVELLLSFGADPFSGAPGQNSAFFEAVIHKSERSLRALLRGQAPNCLDNPRYLGLLTVAINGGWEEGIKALIAHGVNLRAVGRAQLTPASYAIERGEAGCLSLLLGAGVDPREPQANGERLINQAAALFDQGCVEALLRAGDTLLPNELGDPVELANRSSEALSRPPREQVVLAWMREVARSQKEALQIEASAPSGARSGPGARL